MLIKHELNMTHRISTGGSLVLPDDLEELIGVVVGTSAVSVVTVSLLSIEVSWTVYHRCYQFCGQMPEHDHKHTYHEG